MFDGIIKKKIVDALNDPEVQAEIDKFIAERFKKILTDILKGYELVTKK